MPIDWENHLARLHALLPANQRAAILKKYAGDIGPDFLGFTAIYEQLSKIIPRHWTVIDLGCAYNPQCVFFTSHKEFIAVDESDCDKFQSANCRVFTMSIGDFIARHVHEFDIDETFAICSYVPLAYQEDIRSAFKNLFIFYPSDKQTAQDISQAMREAISAKESHADHNHSAR